MEDLESKYIELLLKRCLNFQKSNILFISYDIETNLVYKIVNYAKKIGIQKIFLYNNSLQRKHDILKKISIEEIAHHPAFNKEIWDEYALKFASFLILETEIPGLMDDIDSAKLARAEQVERATRPIYKKLQLTYQIPWCITSIPNKYWAHSLFPNEPISSAYDKLQKNIFKSCMINQEDPIESWNQFLAKQNNFVSKLNSLGISKMHYQNALGTDITVSLNEDAIWTSAGHLDQKMIVNMPTYEIFTTPDCTKTNGIVYSSRPLIYCGGLIDKFYLVFKNGRVVDYNAEIGKELLKSIIDTDKRSSFLGEVALINDDSPISNTGIVFNTTLIDENASCHFALGNGFEECIKNSHHLKQDELLKKGVNFSGVHVDFMIGTKDLTIEADTKKGKITIMKDGNLVI